MQDTLKYSHRVGERHVAIRSRDMEKLVTKMADLDTAKTAKAPIAQTPKKATIIWAGPKLRRRIIATVRVKPVAKKNRA